jgi:molybdopterin-guanine dinucleotide biosynthesis protein A
MGFDKALLEIDGLPMIGRLAAEMSKVCGRVGLVGDPLRYASAGLPVVSDNFPDAGPLAGIEAAFRASRVDANLIVACDMPSANAAVFESLFALAGDVAVPRQPDGRLEPLCAVYSRRCHGRVRELLESGVRRMTEALQLLEAGGFAIRYLEVSVSTAFVNLNTPEDLARYRAERRNG